MRLSIHRPRARASLAPLVGLLLLATATACGGDDGGGDGVASGGGDSVDSESDDGGTGGGGGGGGKGPDEDTRLEFAKCMRENGVEEFPDPDSNNNQFAIPGPEELGVDEETMQAAIEACKDFMPGGGERPELSADDVEKLGEFTECMREEGIDMPDPGPDGGLSLPEGVNPQSAEMQDAMEACRDLAAGLPMLFGGPQGGGQ